MLESWDLLNKLTVVVGEAPVSKKLEFGINNMGVDIQFPVEINHNGNHVVIIDSTEGLSDNIILSGLDCLFDHMENVELKDWTTNHSKGDYTIDYGTYYGQNIEILTYIIN